LKAIIIQPDGSHETIQCADSYQTIKKAVGGWIEAVNSDDDTLHRAPHDPAGHTRGSGK
jgi:hypothetical protein